MTLKDIIETVTDSPLYEREVYEDPEYLAAEAELSNAVHAIAAEDARHAVEDANAFARVALEAAVFRFALHFAQVMNTGRRCGE